MFAELPFTHSKTEVVQLYIAAKSPPFFMAEGNQNTTQVKRKKIKEKEKSRLRNYPFGLGVTPSLTQLEICLHPS